MNDLITNKEQLEKAALKYGMLPFFANKVTGFSIEELAAPGMLFGETSEDYGCWEWKGPVICEQTTAYGKFFRKKAGFVSLELLPDFLNYRRSRYPVSPGSTEATILDIIKEHKGITSTELKNIILGNPGKRTKPTDLTDILCAPAKKLRSIEGPLQRLQMGGWVLIANFEYKHTSRGNRYGWGIALYSTPEIWFGKEFGKIERTPDESFRYLVDYVFAKLNISEKKTVEQLIY